MQSFICDAVDVIMFIMTNFNRNGLIHTISKKILVTVSIALVVLLVSGGGLSSLNAWAIDFDDDNREVLDENTQSDAFSTLPLNPEKNTITGNNDGNEIDGTRRDDIIIGTEGP